MKKSLRLQTLKSLQKCSVIFLAFPLLISMSPAALAGWCDLHIRNNSQYKIRGIYMSHTGKDHWSGNLLEHDDHKHDDNKHRDRDHFDDDHQSGDRSHSYDDNEYSQQDEQIISQGEAVSMRYEYDDKQCYYDMKVVSEHQPEGEIHQVNLCKTTAYEITDDNYGGESRAW